MNQFSSSCSNRIMKSYNLTNRPENQDYGYSRLIKIFLISAVLSSLALVGLYIYNIYILKNFRKEQIEHNLFAEEKLADLEISMTNVKMLIDDYFLNQNELIVNNNHEIKDLQNSISDYVEYVINSKLDRLMGNILNTYNHVNRIEQVYGALLEEQKKKTLVNLYNEEGILDHLKNAEKLFKEGKYGHAYNEYAIVAAEQTENSEVQFYKFYSLFLKNKEDKNQYRVIKKGLMGLRQRGYDRAEIEEVFEYIAAEEDFQISHYKGNKEYE